MSAVIQSEWALFFVRVVVGVVLLYYGVPKIRDPKKNAGDFASMGFRPAWLWGCLGILNEFIGGIAIFVGFYPELFASMFGFQMLIGTLWKKFKLNKQFPEYSYDIQLLALCVVIMKFGGGVYTLLPFTAFTFLTWQFAIIGIALAAFFAWWSEPKF